MTLVKDKKESILSRNRTTTKNISSAAGLEPTHVLHNAFRVHRLNRSAKRTCHFRIYLKTRIAAIVRIWLNSQNFIFDFKILTKPEVRATAP